MDKTYDPHSIEQRWYERWESANDFAPSGKGEPYCIMIPPPNVTGTLHMGHAFQDTLMDALSRYHRMLGHNTLWQPGTDHAGIATQMVVERKLAAEGNISRRDMGREAFVERVWEWKQESGDTITRQLRRMGSSVDWSRERFTMDEGLSAAVLDVFVQLYDEDLIYRGKRLVNWDPVFRTALSDLEVISEEESGHLWHLRYPLADGSGQLVVATTRPETMLGDTGVAVHPEDERYKQLVGRAVALPLTDRKIPIVADEHVDPEFGTGCVKITPAHDFNDYEVGKRHDLEMINIFTVDAMTNDNVPTAYRDLDRYDARKKVVADLEAAGLLEKTEDHKLMVPRGDRSNAVVEPFLTDQWYVKTEPLAKPAIEAVEDGRIRFVPENWSNTYFEWMRNIQDWCISRQLWWGHRIPAWYDNDGNVYVAHSEQAVREKYKLAADLPLTQDEDVLDTWFSSGLWPFSTLGWPEQTDALKTFYPTSVLVTGFDIIFFWVARMIMLGMKFMGDVPFREVYIHGLVRDAEGQKMSKSKGNVLDPIDLIDGISLEALLAKRTTGLMQPQMAARIEKSTRKHFPDGIPAFGTDAMRFTFSALASTGRDIKFDLNRVEGYRNFCNKLWNASRYVLMNTQDRDTGVGEDPVELSLADRWIVSRLQVVEGEVRKHLDSYRFDLASNALHDFVWHDYCDWYLELSKPILQNEATSAEAQRGTRRTLVRVLEATLRLLHPVMPFITEEVWQQVAPLAGKQGHTIQLQPFPNPEPDKIDAQAVTELEWVKTFVMGVRRIRSERDIAPGKALPVMLQNWSDSDRLCFETNEPFITSLARLESASWMDGEDVPEAAVALLGEMKILVSLAGLIDKEAELQRLTREIDKLTANVQKAEAKLGNKSFVERAPANVVEQERTRAAEMSKSIQQLREEADKIQRL